MGIGWRTLLLLLRKNKTLLSKSNGQIQAFFIPEIELLYSLIMNLIPLKSTVTLPDFHGHFVVFAKKNTVTLPDFASSNSFPRSLCRNTHPIWTPLLITVIWGSFPRSLCRKKYGHFVGALRSLCRKIHGHFAVQTYSTYSYSYRLPIISLLVCEFFFLTVKRKNA